MKKLLALALSFALLLACLPTALAIDDQDVITFCGINLVGRDESNPIVIEKTGALGDAGSGTVTYDAATKTITFDNVNLEVTESISGSTGLFYLMIIDSVNSYTLKLVGENSIKVDGFGIALQDASLTITGDEAASLSLTTTVTGDEGMSAGIASMAFPGSTSVITFDANVTINAIIPVAAMSLLEPDNAQIVLSSQCRLQENVTLLTAWNESDDIGTTTFVNPGVTEDQIVGSEPVEDITRFVPGTLHFVKGVAAAAGAVIPMAYGETDFIDIIDWRAMMEDEVAIPDGAAGEEYSTVAPAYLRVAAGRDQKIVKVLATGTDVTVYEIVDGWATAKVGDLYGYIDAQYLK